MRKIIVFCIFLCVSVISGAQNVTVSAHNQPAAKVFRIIMAQTGKNFVYSSDVLSNVRVSVKAHNRPLKKVLAEMLRGTGIDFKIKGKNVILKRTSKSQVKTSSSHKRETPVYVSEDTVTLLSEVIVVSRLDASAVETGEIGAKKITADEVRNIPVLFGESDVIKAVQTQPGVIEGTEGMAGMYVHGGNADENLYMLDNVPLYQVNHFGGLFSAFNTDIIRYIDFFKSSVPAKYDGRLSSFMDVRLKSGQPEGHHGTARLGLTSGAFNISGPIGDKTSYLVGLRRSWYEVLSVPLLALVNSGSDEEKTKFRYSFVDLNAKVSHKFSKDLNAFVSVYFGNDLLKTGSEDLNESTSGWYGKYKYDLIWGNLVAQAGLNYRMRPNLTAEFMAAYTRCFSSLKNDELDKYYYSETVTATRNIMKTVNNVNDWIFRGDFDWSPEENYRVRFGANYVRHSFLPQRTSRAYTFNDTHITSRDSTWAYAADEFNAYMEHDWRISEKWRINAGVHGSLFHIDGKTHYGISPRLSAAWRPSDGWAFKAAYCHTVQYVHQLAQSYLALPTDQWIPISGRFKPQSADKVSLGIYWQSADGQLRASAEGYYKSMYHLIEYADEYYLRPPLEMWNARLTSGRGTAKGIDFSVEKSIGKLTGHVGYSLAWADRTFPEKNGGHTYPARFDNRHTINITLNWNINEKVQLNAAWTGHSGNRFTLLPQVWTAPGFGSNYRYDGDELPLIAGINNYQLPFYHRLDLACTVRNKRGYWTFGLYNAYCHMNTIAVRRSHRTLVEMTPEGIYYVSRPVFQKVKLLPIIPSISYTWQF